MLDDPLSALDVHTETLVEEALRRVLADTTGLIVAHRASTVVLADRVALLQDGAITHVGTHRELLATVPAYRELLGRRQPTPTSRRRRRMTTDTTPTHQSTETSAWRGVAADGSTATRPTERDDRGALGGALAAGCSASC